ncbi:MAG TPA: hypothetical protein VJL60_05680 [Gammaproteobacteria bacterium]|nr:hypothetical protein [Gammaproteobacteria bacterium]
MPTVNKRDDARSMLLKVQLHVEKLEGSHKAQVALMKRITKTQNSALNKSIELNRVFQRIVQLAARIAMLKKLDKALQQVAGLKSQLGKTKHALNDSFAKIYEKVHALSEEARQKRTFTTALANAPEAPKTDPNSKRMRR